MLWVTFSTQTICDAMPCSDDLDNIVQANYFVIKCHVLMPRVTFSGQTVCNAILATYTLVTWFTQTIRYEMPCFDALSNILCANYLLCNVIFCPLSRMFPMQYHIISDIPGVCYDSVFGTNMDLMIVFRNLHKRYMIGNECFIVYLSIYVMNNQAINA